MFGNWINPAEFALFLKKLRRDSDLVRRVTQKLSRDDDSRVRASWAAIDRPGNWWEIPMVQLRWNAMMTGDSSKTYYEYIVEKFLSGGSRLRALSLGCGGGAKERRWAETDLFEHIDAYDVAEVAIQKAQKDIRASKYSNVVSYSVGNAHTLDFPKDHYDMIIFDHSLHHFSPMESLLLRVRESMKANGLLVASEFVGPSRFQWTRRQLEVINGLLNVFPKEYLSLWNSPLPRLHAWRPSKLSMWLSDPSESVESSHIIPLLHKHFSVVEQKGYGGAILHLLFAGIAHHFFTPDQTAERLLRLSFDVEDLLLKTGDIGHDFALIIARK